MFNLRSCFNLNKYQSQIKSFPGNPNSFRPGGSISFNLKKCNRADFKMKKAISWKKSYLHRFKFVINEQLSFKLNAKPPDNRVDVFLRDFLHFTFVLESSTSGLETSMVWLIYLLWVVYIRVALTFFSVNFVWLSVTYVTFQSKYLCLAMNESFSASRSGIRFVFTAFSLKFDIISSDYVPFHVTSYDSGWQKKIF